MQQRSCKTQAGDTILRYFVHFFWQVKYKTPQLIYAIVRHFTVYCNKLMIIILATVNCGRCKLIVGWIPCYLYIVYFVRLFTYNHWKIGKEWNEKFTLLKYINRIHTQWIFIKSFTEHFIQENPFFVKLTEKKPKISFVCPRLKQRESKMTRYSNDSILKKTL